jgi:hypothetical protein
MIHIKCQHHPQERGDIAHIDRDVDGFLHVFLRAVDPYRTEREDMAPKRPKPLPEGSMPLEGPWVAGHWGGIDTIETWCKRCRGYHPLPHDWLTEIMNSERDAFPCPCPVLPSGA